MRLLVLATDYPDNTGRISLYYIHTRNVFYVKNGINVDVINFAAKESYTKNGVNVITYEEFKKRKDYNYDLLILHAANLRNHYRFLKKYGKKFKKHVYFFHGHEVLMCSKVYSKPYNYMHKKGTIIKDLYDTVKLKIWHNYFLKTNYKNHYIFVSEWMKEQFEKWVKIDPKTIANNSTITYNSIDKEFTNSQYETSGKKEYDFITIRGNLDGSKYSIDIVNELAKSNPKEKFLVIGKGKFFNYNKKAENLKWIDANLNHQQIIKYLNKTKCALMPTRTDAQGLMACEMASFGIPLITSDIPVCHEIFGNFKNVSFINNNVKTNRLKEHLKSISKYANVAPNSYHLSVTGKKEINYLKKILEK